MKISEFCSKLDAQMNARPAGLERMDIAVQFLCRAFRIQAHEVAIFALDKDKETLNFLVPAKLQSSGQIPLSSSSSLVVRTVRENKAFLNNHFASAQHSFIFEHVRLDSENKNSPFPIQKILSVPLMAEGEVKGVIQVSRKGKTPESAGGDFSKNDLATLVEVSKVVAKYL